MVKSLVRVSNALLIISALLVCGVGQAWLITKLIPTYVAADVRPLYEYPNK